MGRSRFFKPGWMSTFKVDEATISAHFRSFAEMLFFNIDINIIT